jgi:hypothetical protein
MLDQRFILLGVAIGFAGGVSYLIQTLQGKIRPNRVSWFMWSLAPLIAFSAELSQGVGLVAFSTFITGFNPLLIFFASFFNKKAEWKITRFDLICGALSIAGLILWSLTRVGNIAIAASILADGLAALPTIRKCYLFPETESGWAFAAGGANAIIGLLTLKHWSFAQGGFLVYIALVCILMSGLIWTKLGTKLRSGIVVPSEKGEA